MTWRDICDAWSEDLALNVPELAGARRHLYAPVSVEALFAEGEERHVAVWPEAEAESSEGFVTTPGVLLRRQFVITVWESASNESTRRIDDEERAAAWLELQEAIVDRILRRDAIQMGGVDSTSYAGTQFGLAAGVRFIELRLRTVQGRDYV